MKWTKINIATLATCFAGGYMIGVVVKEPIAIVYGIIFGLCVGTIGGLINIYNKSR